MVKQAHRGANIRKDDRFPIRTCVGCGTRRPPSEMLRVAAPCNGEPYLVREEKVNGRSAYVCRTLSCVERTLTRRALERSLKLKTGVPADVKNLLRQAVESLQA